MANDLVVQKQRLPGRPGELHAAQYVRMSTDKQRYSIENQAAVIAAYAHARGLEIVRTYADRGESGLHIKNRLGLQQLISDVVGGTAAFSHVLVYDVSRWGRFQDTDESAHYEFICRRAGVKVAYCAEQFDNDGSMLSSIVKNLKRVMAAEYSRELGVKIHAGACRSVKLGFRHGGKPGYGLRRELIDEKGCSKGPMKDGERKYLQSDRVRLRPGPPAELEIVRTIFSRFVVEKHSQKKIARELNREGVASANGKRWQEGTIHYILKNENYIGNLLYNRTSGRLGEPRRSNTSDLWIRMEHTFEPIIELSLFIQAQKRLDTIYLRRTDEEMLALLRTTLKRHGRLSKGIMDGTPNVPSTALYQQRFGSVRNAYKLIGYAPKRSCHDIDTRADRAAMVTECATFVAKKLEAQGKAIRFDASTDTLSIRGHVDVSLRIARCSRGKGNFRYWTIVRRVYQPPGWIFVARLTESNDAILDYLLLAAAKMPPKRFRVTDHMIGTMRAGLARFDTREAAVRSLVHLIDKDALLKKGKPVDGQKALSKKG